MVLVIKRVIRAVGRFLLMLARVPLVLPKSMWLGLRRHYREINEPIDVVAYYSRGQGIRRALASNATTMISLALFLVMAMKIYAVSQGNGQTMLALTQHFNTAQIGAAILIGLSPYILQFFYRVFNSVVESHRHPREVLSTFWIAYGIGLILSMGLLPYWATTISILYPLAMFAIHGTREARGLETSSTDPTSSSGIPYTEWMKIKHNDTVQLGYAKAMQEIERDRAVLTDSDVRRRQELGDKLSELVALAMQRREAIALATGSWNGLRVTVGLGVIFYFVVVVVNPRPWLPLEKVTSAGGVEIGYVLADDGRWTQLLLDESRLVVNRQSDGIVERSYCTKTGTGRGRTLLEILARDIPEQYPKC